MSWPNTPATNADGGYLTIGHVAAEIGEALENWATPKGGRVKVVVNLRHLWEEIYQVGDVPTVLVCYVGETPRGSFDEQDFWHRVDRQWSVVVMRGHGFTRNLMPDKVGETTPEPFYDTVEQVRDLVRSMRSISSDPLVNYKGMAPLPGVAVPGQANVFLDSYELKFSTANDIPEIQDS